jgi:thiol-disulfide isomerase/thioredoxin
MQFNLKSLLKSARSRALIALVIIGFLGFLAYYFMYMNNQEGFDSVVKTTPMLNPNPSECVVALFYADWCPHCVDFKPIFEKAKEMMDKKTCKAPKQKGKTLRFELVDCVANPDLAEKYKVKGFPTVKLITDSDIEEYSAGRDLDSMNNYFFPN